MMTMEQARDRGLGTLRVVVPRTLRLPDFMAWQEDTRRILELELESRLQRLAEQDAGWQGILEAAGEMACG